MMPCFNKSYQPDMMSKQIRTPRISGFLYFYLDSSFEDSLAGRKRIFILKTLSFEEFLYFTNHDAFYKLAMLLSGQTGNLVNRNELSNTIGIDNITIERYLFVLQRFFWNIIPVFLTKPSLMIFMKIIYKR